jgi:hypothetical protein
MMHNAGPFVQAIEYLRKRYHINHIKISGYNSRENRIVERSHFDVRQAFFKAADREESNWSQAAHSVFWQKELQLGSAWVVHHTMW